MRRKDKKVLNRIIISAVLFALSLVVSHFSGILGICIMLVSYAVIGCDVLFRAGRGIINGQLFDENFLMAIATVGALVIGEYHEAVFVMLFYQVGELFQSIAVGKSRRSIAALCDMRPDIARVLKDGEFAEVDPNDVTVGDIIEVRPGERIPLDGEVASGNGYVNASALTGESVPLFKKTGDQVLSGCVSENGVLQIRVSAEFSSSTVTKILELVENSTANKSKSEAFITRFARFCTPCVVIAALMLAVMPPLFLGIANADVWRDWVYRAMTFLVISCPCALVISVPLTFFGGIGCASKNGILVKGANYLEALSKCDTVVFDKTGTLTEGRFTVSHTNGELTELAAAAECKSSHPIAQAITAAATGKYKAYDHTELAGKGVRAVLNDKVLYAGNSALMQDIGIDTDDGDGATSVHVAYNGDYCGCITLKDTVKSDAKAAIARLKQCGIAKTVMLTGDKHTVAQAVADDIGIDEVKAELLPQDKVSVTERLIEGGTRVAFVGDGINDAPVLARADIGIAMGGVGSDAAIEAADIVIMDDSPSKIATAISISRFTRKIVKQNIVFVLAVKALTLLLGALGLANMWMAVFADVGVAVIAILNAVRTIKYKI